MKEHTVVAYCKTDKELKSIHCASAKIINGCITVGHGIEHRKTRAQYEKNESIY